MLAILSTGPLAVIGNSDSRTKDIAPSNYEYNIVSMTWIMNTLSITCMHEIAMLLNGIRSAITMDT